MKKISSLLSALVIATELISAAIAPAPLFRDPVTDGAADPCVVFNRNTKEWWMLYTQRRANSETAGVAYCYGNPIGVASSDDGGATWVYRGTLDLDFEPGHNTFWAPDVVWDGEKYHMYVSYIKGVRTNWGGQAVMMHYTSPDLWNWTFQGSCNLPKNNIIDATLLQKPDGEWRMWYKWDSKTCHADSKDLSNWEGPETPDISDRPHEGAKAFRFKDKYWIIVDEWHGMAVHSSDDLENWTRQEPMLLDYPSTRSDDYPTGAHGDVVVAGDRAWIFYFTHPGREAHTRDHQNEIGNISYELRRSSIQVAELELTPEGILTTKDRNLPVDIHLPAEL